MDVVFGGLEEQLAKLVDTMEAMQNQQNKQDAGQVHLNNKMNALKLLKIHQSSSRQEIGQGLLL